MTKRSKLKRDIYQEAIEADLTLLEYKNQPSMYGLYKINRCGHEQSIQYVHVRNNNFKCSVCYGVQREEVYKTADVELISDCCEGRDANYKLVKINSCGHTQAITLEAIKSLEFSCVICKNVRWAEEASVHGLEVIGKGKDSRYLTYKLPCGHVQEFQKGNVKRGSFSCDVCDGNKHGKGKKSYLYMLLLKRKNFEWIKIGYSMNIDRRIQQYDLIDGCDIYVAERVEFANRKEVAAVENKIHKLCSAFSLDSDIMEAFMLAGYTECYKIDNYKEVIKIFKEEVKNAKDSVR